MSVKWEKLEGNQGVLTVEVEAEKLNEGLDAAFQKSCYASKCTWFP